jgi:hypothetical protein
LINNLNVDQCQRMKNAILTAIYVSLQASAMPGFEDLFRAAVAGSSNPDPHESSHNADSLTYSRHSIPEHVKRWALDSARSGNSTPSGIAASSYTGHSKALNIAGGGANSENQPAMGSSNSGDSKSETVPPEIKVRIAIPSNPIP